jgi:hypothetical protein
MTTLATPGPSVLDHRLGSVATCYLLGALSALTSASLTAFYLVEVNAPYPHLFGPVSDVGGAVYGVLLVPLVLALSGRLLTSAAARILVAATVAVALLSSVTTILMVLDRSPFSVTTAISVVSIFLQGAWLVLWSRAQSRRASAAYPRHLRRLGLWLPAGLCWGAIVSAVSLPFGWGSHTQMAILVAGLVPGVLAWFAWAVWWVLLGRYLQSRVCLDLG